MSKAQKKSPFQRHRKAFWRELLPIWLGGAFAYLFLAGENLSVAHDSIAYLNEFELSEAISYYPHHLLWHWLVSGWIDLWPWDTPIYLRIEYLNG
ncbi:MAG: hypothetical protein AAF399_12900, partial [Bacteroidota bacterium]